MKLTLSQFLFFTIFITNCTSKPPKLPEGHYYDIPPKYDKSQKHLFNTDTCDVLFSDFNYPEDVVNMSEKKYVCADTLFLTRFPNLRNIDYRAVFQDKNFLLLDIIPRERGWVVSKLLWDKQRDLLICFTTLASNGDFEPGSLRYHFFLDDNLIPTHTVRYAYTENEQTVFEKLSIADSTGMMWMHQFVLKNDTLPPLEKMSYKHLLKFDSIFKQGQYSIGKRVFEYRMHINAWQH